MKKYSIIYADPPWEYRNKTIRGGAQKHYSTMSIEEICALPIERIRASDCALFLWATQPNISMAQELLEAWGFRYINFAFTWVKLNKLWMDKLVSLATAPTEEQKLFELERLFFMGNGFYTRGNPEVCLLGIRGKMPVVAKNVRQLVVSPLGEHSEKPPEVRQRIEALYGDVPRIELFARKDYPGWATWGDETQGSNSYVAFDRPDWA